MSPGLALAWMGGKATFRVLIGIFVLLKPCDTDYILGASRDEHPEPVLLGGEPRGLP